MRLRSSGQTMNAFAQVAGDVEGPRCGINRLGAATATRIGGLLAAIQAMRTRPTWLALV